MIEHAQGRYANTDQFLAHIDEPDRGSVPAEDAFGPLDPDEGSGADTDPGYAVRSGDVAPVWDESAMTGPDEFDESAVTGPDEFDEPGPVGALPAFPTASNGGGSEADDDGGQWEPDPDYGDLYAPDPDYGDGGHEPDPDYGGDFGPFDTRAHMPATGDPRDAGDQDAHGPGDEPPTATPRFSKPIVIGFVGAVAVVTIVLAAAMVGMQSSPTAAPSASSPTAVSVVAPPAAQPTGPAPLNDPSQDAPIAFQASSPCPQAGSGSAQNVASDDPTRAWVCMRDSDGQVMTLDLGKPMKVTAIELTPGWVGTDASGADQWMAHRVVTRVQWILVNGADRTVVTQDTKNAHGPVPQAMPSNGPDQGVLASQIQMIVLQTSRPPADTPAPTTPGAGPSDRGLLDGVLGAPMAGGDSSPAPNQDPTFGTTDTGSDPVDNTVAISSIKILGHPPL